MSIRQRTGTPTTRPLACHRCKAQGKHPTLTVERGVQKRTKNGRKREHVNVLCSNGHEWWSVHPKAIERSRNRDALARAGGIER
jgi:hypothetical protein